MKQFFKYRGVENLKDFGKWAVSCVVALAYIPALIYWVFMANWGAGWIEKLFGKKVKLK